MEGWKGFHYVADLLRGLRLHRTALHWEVGPLTVCWWFCWVRICATPRSQPAGSPGVAISGEWHTQNCEEKGGPGGTQWCWPSRAGVYRAVPMPSHWFYSSHSVLECFLSLSSRRRLVGEAVCVAWLFDILASFRVVVLAFIMLLFNFKIRPLVTWPPPSLGRVFCYRLV